MMMSSVELDTQQKDRKIFIGIFASSLMLIEHGSPLKMNESYVQRPLTAISVLSSLVELCADVLFAESSRSSSSLRTWSFDMVSGAPGRGGVQAGNNLTCQIAVHFLSHNRSDVGG